MAKELRPYQHKFHEASANALQKGIDKQLALMATGTGKTFSVVRLIELLGFKKALWITHTEELVDQSALAFIREQFDESLSKHIESVGFVDYIRSKGAFAGKEFKMGLIKADIFQPQGNVVMASAATLHRRLHLLKPTDFDVVICDEAHLFCSPSFVKSVNYFSPTLLLGVTATGYRADGLPLGNIFDEVVYEYDISEAVKDGYLCEIDAIRVSTKVNLDSVRTLGGEFNQKELSNEIDTLARNNLVVDSYIKYAKGRKGIFFGCNIQHCLNLVEAFQQKGIKAEAVSSDEELTGDRSLKVAAYKRGEIEVLVNVNILTTGFDEPDTGVIGAACPTKSKTKYMQMIGRGTRLKSEGYVGKFGQNVIILDFVDATNRHSIVNCHEMEKDLPPEERTFISAEKREKLIADRAAKSAKLEHTQDKDERVKLLSLPKVKINRSIRMSEPATEAQLNAIKNWGYDIENVHYTKMMVNEIFMQQSASEKQIGFLKWKGYDVSKGVSKAQASLAFNEINARETKK